MRGGKWLLRWGKGTADAAADRADTADTADELAGGREAGGYLSESRETDW